MIYLVRNLTGWEGGREEGREGGRGRGAIGATIHE
jgi:hypothetical protein